MMNNGEYKALIEYLFTRIAISSSRDSLDALTEIINTLSENTSKAVKDDGIFDELREWIGLKMDKNPVSHRYGDGIISDFPEYFPELSTYVKDEEIGAEMVLSNAHVSADSSLGIPEIAHIKGNFLVITGKVERKSW
jgi:hypothetical protein